jgi:uncharacterized membrane protein
LDSIPFEFKNILTCTQSHKVLNSSGHGYENSIVLAAVEVVVALVVVTTVAVVIVAVTIGGVVVVVHYFLPFFW